eukprot:4203613-Prorocentrum_lima.AAC.1
MTAIVMRIANDPMGQTIQKRNSRASEPKSPRSMNRSRSLRSFRAGDENAGAADAADLSETELVERALEKIAALLQVGFGIAGAKVITQCVSRKGDDVDVMMPGQLVTA